MKEEKIVMICGEEEKGERLDKFIARRLEDRTRQYVQKLISAGEVKVNGRGVKAGYRIKNGDEIRVRIPPPVKLALEPKERNLDIIYEDKDYLVLNKPEGMVVHPGAGETHIKDSLVNVLLAHCGDSLSGIGGVMRPGIVHRLDKDTSGLMVVAKNDKAHGYFSALFKERKVNKTYLALLGGHLESEKGVIDSPIGRDPRERKRMAVTTEAKGRSAMTKFRVIERYKEATLVEVKLITGRTHQIRVHFEAIGFPLVGDRVYGRAAVNKRFDREYGLGRMFLHAVRLEFVPPGLKKAKVFEAVLPEELKRTIKLLKRKNRA